MPTISGAAARTASTRPSTVLRSYCLSLAWMTNANSGLRPSTSARTASGPLAMRRSQGSIPPSATATYVCAKNRWSSP